MPLLVIWCSAAGIIGGMVSAKLQMDLSYGFFIDTLPRVVPVANVWIGIGKGLVFGVLIALIACHFGLQGQAEHRKPVVALTTSSVVTSITVAILVDAVFAVLTRNLGMPCERAPFPKPGEAPPAIEIRGLCTQFGDVVIHRDIDLDIEAGQMLGLVGGSGSGKTTLLREIVGLLAPSKGTSSSSASRCSMPIRSVGARCAAASACSFSRARSFRRSRSLTTSLFRCANCAVSTRR
jgi:ABC-type multidrug transport system fused ATPase/permease subunit